MVEQLGKRLLIVLLQLVILIQEPLFLLFILKLKSRIFKDLHNDILWLFLQENITDTQKTSKFLELAVD